MTRTGSVTCTWVVTLGLATGCTPIPSASVTASVTEPAATTTTPPDPASSGRDGPYFSGAAALARVQTLMDWPRGLGHPRRHESIEALGVMLEMAGADQVDTQALTAADPATGQVYALVNLIAHVRPDAPRRFVLATHFDTRPWADEEEDPSAHDQPVPGANDGTSGVAVVLELMSVLVRVLPAPVGLTVILFDGEELGRPGYGGYCMGSRHFAAQVARQRPAWIDQAQLGIVFDMVGDRDLHLPIEPGSATQAPGLIERLWATARARGHVQFEDRVRPVGVLDDHVFLGQAGVPSVLIIDRDYDAWHTRRDTIDRVSAQSLAAVGDTVLYTLLELAAAPAD